MYQRAYTNRREAVRRAALAAAWLALAASFSAGCTAVARHGAAAGAPKDPATPWNPPPEAMPKIEVRKPSPAFVDEFMAVRDNLTLEDIVDVALRNNPATKASWQTARAAAAAVGSRQGAYYPQINASANYTKTKNSFSRQFSFQQTSYEPSGSLQFILFDFGKRRADVDQARQALYSTNWTHNATIQNVILQVETAYYNYLYAKSMRSADSAAVHEAYVNLDAAQERRKAGLATVADVLQAKSTHAQAKLALQQAVGQVETVRGSLATAMGLPPTIKYDVGFLPNRIPTDQVTKTVDELLSEAQTHRPDLAAARASALSAEAHAKSVARSGLPVITLQGQISRLYFNNPHAYSDNYSEGAFLSVSLFSGFSHSYDVVQSRALAEEAAQQYELTRSRVELDVWTSYYDLKTAAERVTTALEYLDSATEAHEVVLARYKAGVGSILDLLSAQTALQDARAQDVQARADWFIALVNLAYATGRLDIRPGLSMERTTPKVDKDTPR